MIIVVMGVTGCGKSTVGKLLADRLAIPFVEGDDFHSAANIDKMRHGIPLADEDRAPWLQSLNDVLKNEEDKKGAVLACSALKESYRQVLQHGLREKITWIYLEGSEETLRTRMEHRPGHFMPEALLHSQLATLEVPSYARRFSIEKDPATIVDEILQTLPRSA